MLSSLQLVIDLTLTHFPSFFIFSVMEFDAEAEDILSVVDPNESDFLSSGDEYRPEDDPDNSDSEMEMPSTSKKRKVQKSNKRRKEEFEDSSSDDDIPLSRVQEKLRQRARSEEEVLSQILDEPMWSQIPFQSAADAFSGPTEAMPEELKSPYQFFTELVTDEMLQKVADETNLYVFLHSGIELKTTQKEIETFIGMYLRMGIMKARCVRAYWATTTH